MRRLRACDQMHGAVPVRPPHAAEFLFEV